MLLPLTITTQTEKVGDKLAARTLFTLGPERFMNSVRMFTLAEWSPLSHVKPFPPDQEVLPNLLRSPPHELEVLTLASLLLTRVLAKSSILHHLELMFAIQMITEAPRQLPDPGALILPLIIVQSHIYS